MAHPWYNFHPSHSLGGRDPGLPSTSISISSMQGIPAVNHSGNLDWSQHSLADLLGNVLTSLRLSVPTCKRGRLLKGLNELIG